MLELLPLFVVLLLLLLDFFCLLLDEDSAAVARGSTGRLEADRDVWCDASASFSGDDGESLEFVSWVIGLYGGMGLTLPPFFYGKRSISFDDILRVKYTTHQFTVVMLAISAVLYVIQVIPSFLAQQTQLLRTRHVKLLLAA